MAYATLADLRQYLSQVPAGDEWDALLERILARAHGIVNDYLRFEYGDWGDRATLCDHWQESPSCRLEPPPHQGGSVESVHRVSGRGTARESSVEVVDWIEEGGGRLYRDSGWARGWYRVTAIWGYGPVPDQVVEVELRVAVNIWRGKDASQWQSDLGAEGQGSVTYSRGLTGAERSILDAVYRERHGYGYG